MWSCGDRPEQQRKVRSDLTFAKNLSSRSEAVMPRKNEIIFQWRVRLQIVLRVTCTLLGQRNQLNAPFTGKKQKYDHGGVLSTARPVHDTRTGLTPSIPAHYEVSGQLWTYVPAEKEIIISMWNMTADCPVQVTRTLSNYQTFRSFGNNIC